MDAEVPLVWYLYFAAASFVIGLLGVMIRRNAIAVLMAIEIILSAANINFVAFWRFHPPTADDGSVSGVMMALFVITVAAAEVAVGIALVLLCYRARKTVDIDQFDQLSG